MNVRRGCIVLRERVYCLPLAARVLGSFPLAWLFGCTLNLVVRGRWGMA